MIRLSHIEKSYCLGSEAVQALSDISLHVRPGEFVSIVGPSGSGKSTLMNILGLLDIPDSGAYYLDGQEVSTLSDNGLAALRNQKIGFVFQNFNLLSKLSALENVKLPLSLRRERHIPSQLSGGQQQRVAIARALIGQPEIILADEPTGALDSKTSIEIMSLFQRLNQQGQTIVLITHNLGLARETGRVLQIFDGRLCEDTSGGAPCGCPQS